MSGNPKCFFDITADGAAVGRIVMEVSLYLPKFKLYAHLLIQRSMISVMHADLGGTMAACLGCHLSLPT